MMAFPHHPLQTEAVDPAAPLEAAKPVGTTAFGGGAKPAMSRRALVAGILLCVGIYAVVGSVVWLGFHR